MHLTELNARLQSYLNNFALDQKQGGCSLTIFYQGEKATSLGAGVAFADGDKQIPFTPSTLSLNFSTGKGILVTLIHVLVSQKLIDYDTPIAQYWQNFGQNGKQAITLRQVLSHEAGLFDITSVTEHAKDMLDWQVMIAKIEQMTISPSAIIAQQHGEKLVAYSALVSGWVLGGLIEQVTALSLQQALEKYLLEPLNLVGQVYMGVPTDKIDQVTKPFREKEDRAKPTMVEDSQATLNFYQSLPLYDIWEKAFSKRYPEQDFSNLSTQQINSLYFDPTKIDINDYKSALVPVGSRQFNYYHPSSLQAKIPAANTVASGEALATIYAMLANGGEWHGKTLISSEVFQQLSQTYNNQQDKVMPAVMQWRLGYHRIFSLDLAETAFGHMGYNGSMAWCNPSKQLAVAFTHNYDVTMMNDVRQFIINETILEYFN